MTYYNVFILAVLFYLMPIILGKAPPGLFNNFGPHEEKLRLCNEPYDLKYKLPTVPSCLLAADSTTEKAMEINITTWWPRTTSQSVIGYECYGKKRYKRSSYFAHLGYSNENTEFEEPVREHQCRDMVKSKVDPQHESMRGVHAGMWTSEKDHHISYVYGKTNDRTWWNYYLVERKTIIDPASGDISSAATTTKECNVREASCPTMLKGVLVWDPPRSDMCNFKPGPRGTCIKLGNSISCPGGLGWSFDDIRIEKICRNNIAVSGTNIYFTPDSDTWDKSLSSTAEFSIFNSAYRNKRQLFSPQNVADAQAKFLHDMYRNVSNVLAFEIYQRTCQNFANSLRRGIYEARNGNPSFLIASTLGEDFVGSMAGDVVEIAKCRSIYHYKFQSRGTNCAAEWPVKFVQDGEQKTGWVTPSHEIIFTPTSVRNCKDFYFTANGVAYKLNDLADLNPLLELPIMTGVPMPIDLAIPDRIARVPGIYNVPELTDHANVYAIMREVKEASRLQTAIKHYKEGNSSHEEVSWIEDIKNATVKPIAKELSAVANKITAFFATIGAIATVVVIVVVLALTGALPKVIDATKSVLKFIFKPFGMLWNKCFGNEEQNADVQAGPNQIRALWNRFLVPEAQNVGVPAAPNRNRPLWNRFLGPDARRTGRTPTGPNAPIYPRLEAGEP